jgi:large subunit ribosomal protein L21
MTAVVVSGGKQYRVAAGDRILVDRMHAEPGSEVPLGGVLMIADGDRVKVTPEELQGLEVTARVLQHQRGPKIDVIRYKPKKRVRVRRGARADLTALEVVSVGQPAAGQPAPKRGAASRSRRAKAAPEPAEEGNE